MIRDQLGLGDLNQHPRQLILDELIGCDRALKHLAITGKISGGLKTGYGRSKRTTGHTETGGIQTLKHGFKPNCFGQQILAGDLTVF